MKSEHSNMLQQHANMGETMTFFLQIKLRLVGKINDQIECITSGWFFLSWFQHDMSKFF